MHWSLYQKALSSSEWYPHWSSQRLWDWWAYMTWMPFATSMALPTAPVGGRRARMRGQLSPTFGQHTTGLAWCATNATTTHQPHQTPYAAMAGRTANPQEREASMSQPCQSNCQQETCRVNLFSSRIWTGESRGTQLPLGCLIGDIPPISTALEENQIEKVPPANPKCPITCFPTHLDQEAACYSGITQDVCQQCWTL